MSKLAEQLIDQYLSEVKGRRIDPSQSGPAKDSKDSLKQWSSIAKKLGASVSGNKATFKSKSDLDKFTSKLPDDLYDRTSPGSGSSVNFR